jgi:hypothetical protein
MLKLTNKFQFIIMLSVILSGCQTIKFDYTAFKASKPSSILVLPPLNESVDVNAPTAVYSSVVAPLSESGYYVFPPTLVMETFKQNGLTEARPIHDISMTKLNEIFGADAVLYMNIKKFGQSYSIITSANVVSLEAYLVDAKTGTEIWRGQAVASSDENNSNSNMGLAGLLVSAVIKQVAGQIFDSGFPTSKIANGRLLSAKTPNSLLYGPRHEKFGTNGQ